MSKIVLVTGASSGIGWDIVQYLNNKGFKVIAAARRLDRMSPLKEQGIYTVKMDVGDSASIDAALADIRSHVGEVDVLVNNAGVMYMAPAEVADMEEIKHLFNINLFSVIELTQKCLPHMRTQGWGRVLNVTSTGGIRTMPFNNVYASGKFALEGWTRCLKQEVRQYGIEVAVIRPGAIKSDIYEGSFVSDDEYGWAGPYKEDFARVMNTLNELMNENSSEPVCISEIVYEAITSDSLKVGYIGPKALEDSIQNEMQSLTEDERDRQAAERWDL